MDMPQVVESNHDFAPWIAAIGGCGHPVQAFRGEERRVSPIFQSQRIRSTHGGAQLRCLVSDNTAQILNVENHTGLPIEYWPDT
jgi:hypothetical protein